MTYERCLSWVIFVLLLGAACSESPPSVSHEEARPVLRILASQVSTTERDLLQQFEKQYGISIEVRPFAPAASASLLQSSSLKGADMLWTTDVALLEQAKREGYLHKPDSLDVIRQAVFADSRDSEDYWFAFAKSVWVLAVHSSAAPIPQTYEEIADPRWAGRVLLTDTSLQDYQGLLSVLMVAVGETRAYQWANQIRQNAHPQSHQSIESLLQHLNDTPDGMLLTGSHRLGQTIEEGKYPNIRVFFPNQLQGGSIPKLRLVALLKDAQEPVLARQLLEFLVSREAQTQLCQDDYRYSVRADVDLTNLLQEWGEVELRQINWSELPIYERRANDVIEIIESARSLEKSISPEDFEMPAP